jgi:AbrB family looped-hinge helix DNA binding protein
MVMRAINVRPKGQITLPAEIRHELGIEAGDRLLIMVRGKEIVVISPDNVEDPTAGALAEYAYTRNPDPAEERRWVARHIAETADNGG